MRKQYDYNFFICQGLFFYEGQTLYHYSCHGEFLGSVKINKFIKHYRRKTKVPYVCVSIQFFTGRKNDFTTFDAEKYLGTMFRTEPISFCDFFENKS